MLRLIRGFFGVRCDFGRHLCVIDEGLIAEVDQWVFAALMRQLFRIQDFFDPYIFFETGKVNDSCFNRVRELIHSLPLLLFEILLHLRIFFWFDDTLIWTLDWPCLNWMLNYFDYWNMWILVHNQVLVELILWLHFQSSDTSFALWPSHKRLWLL